MCSFSASRLLHHLSSNFAARCCRSSLGMVSVVQFLLYLLSSYACIAILIYFSFAFFLSFFLLRFPSRTSGSATTHRISCSRISRIYPQIRNYLRSHVAKVATNSFSIHVMKKLLAVSNSGSLSVSLLQKIHGNLIKEAHDKSRSVTKAPAMKGGMLHLGCMMWLSSI
ncbi:uncharacterized protein LOC107646166 [Arachis ipaensis]|uniref:uncharacterized protein LOC107646166 n=1 Tax=Arachis ipaensis TaxID=130454 RepID=UPI000A2B7079|nr:uncharacterized protein LOC107646166 [Arachis ipaensis]XP_020959908.1 uncharacterized protein LOC107646166 [Arachis ipaensis]XP_020959909.1 uncharacterized protein LOC107646166 [Arachis ipaensis]XP_020959910.1 uncharacterized protein LOC107646166 [Arachis ipaensis]